MATAWDRWASLPGAFRYATQRAETTGRRQVVRRTPGRDQFGEYGWTVEPTDRPAPGVMEPCS